ncbi:AbrB/MazE/SpoVT family DNA-binding domain-containing protein [Candidatus Bathyarchaeota archaeon]|nr:AbrB/MazE/SpoVT family DNA-binding domain-containing protein [Candidatus Bathyarchaeota archaeon]
MILKRKIGSKGQVVIPKDVRQYVGVEPGSEVIFEVRGGEVVLKPSRAPDDIVNEYLSIVTSKLKSRIQLDQIIEEEALEEIAIRR